MTDVRVVTPSDLSTDFVWDAVTKKWKIAIEGGAKISTDIGNALTSGIDGGVFLGTSDLKRYRIRQDNVARKIFLHEIIQGQELDPDTGIVGVVDMAVMDLTVDDIAIDNGTLTFTDVHSGNSFVLDTNDLVRNILKANSSSIKITGDGKDTQLTMDLIVDPNTNNILKVTTSGAMVSKDDILAIIQANTTSTQVTFELNPEEGLEITVNGTTKRVPTKRMTNTGGDVLGYVLAPPEVTEP